ncbi:hypothetical protein SJAV_16390 [Sulfurisphaera javensis]|uniref:Uncharacterized protein n=1 Tax=Sulfurisphaera javensis TaxID=2049879 RepID=A0AAT9GSL7_9CREN
MRLAEQYIKSALSLCYEMLLQSDASKAGKVWENVIKAIVAFAQEKSGKDVLAYALAFSSFQGEFKTGDYIPIVKETLKVAEKIGIQDKETLEIYEKVKDQLSRRSS